MTPARLRRPTAATSDAPTLDADARRADARERQRLARARRRAAEMVVPVVVDVAATERLVAAGLLRADDDSDREAVARAIAEALRRGLPRHA